MGIENVNLFLRSLVTASHTCLSDIIPSLWTHVYVLNMPKHCPIYVDATTFDGVVCWQVSQVYSSNTVARVWFNTDTDSYRLEKNSTYSAYMTPVMAFGSEDYRLGNNTDILEISKTGQLLRHITTVEVNATTTDTAATVTTETTPTSNTGYTDRDNILIGYELETDSWIDDEVDFDEEGYDNAIQEWIDNNMPDTSYFSSRTIQRIEEDLRENAIENVDRCDYESSCEGSWDDIPENIPGFKAHRDGSVEGPEIVLASPQSIDKAKSMTDSLFSYVVDEVGATINEGCSFHIHISVKGRKHTYGNGIQALMTDYVLHQAIAGRLPASLLNRWCNGPMSQYFPIELESDKYQFIAHRDYDDYATWEFRCFGNIRNARDAKTCIDVAVEAYCWAYAMVKLHGVANACMRVFGSKESSDILDYLNGLVDNEVEAKLTELRNIARRSA